MFQIVTALTPIFLLILLGWMFRRWDFPGESFWPMAERITYHVFFPALLFNSLFTARFHEMHVVPVAMTVILSMLMVSAVMLALRKRTGLSGRSFSSFFQGGVRPNTYVGISAAYILFDSQGLGLAALVIAVMIPLSNLLSVVVVSVLCNNTQAGRLHTVSALLRNPLILACVLGIVANQVGLQLAFGTRELVTVLSQASLPLGLLSVGAGLHFQGLAAGIRIIGLTSVIKLGLLPLFAAILALMFGVDPDSTMVVLIFAALPCGPAAYILARQLGGDTQLIAEIITVQTLAAFLTMPLVLGALGMFVT